MITILGIILVFGILVFVHEGGHFIVAKLFRVGVDRFSFGFGPKLIGINWKGTEYRISLIPLGGYVKMAGEQPEEFIKSCQRHHAKGRSALAGIRFGEDNPLSGKWIEKIISEGSEFISKKWWQRALIAFSGPFANFLLAIFALSLSFLIGKTYFDFPPVIGKIEETIEISDLQVGDKITTIDGKEIKGWNDILKIWTKKKYHLVTIIRDGKSMELELKGDDYNLWISQVKPVSQAVVGEVAPGMPAYQSGLKRDDRILKINDKIINNWYNMTEIITKNPGKELNFVIKRGNDTLNLSIMPQINIMENKQRGIIGITQKLPIKITENYGLFNSLKYGILSAIGLVYQNYYGLWKLATNPGYISENLGGPILIASITGRQVKGGWDSFLCFISLLSIVLMVLNLLPIPILDGGHILFAIIEAIRGKMLDFNIQLKLQKVGLIILMSLMVFAFYNDITRFVKRQLSISLIRDNVIEEKK